jgi:hypothetical protein
LVEDLHYRVRVRNRDDTADLLVASSVPGDETPFIAEPPTGDGQKLEPTTGAPTTGSYSVMLIDAELEDGSRFVTKTLADERARQQWLSLRAYVDVSDDLGETWTVAIPGYVNALRKVTAMSYQLEIGDTRRKEVSKTIFAKATGHFGNVTTVIGGPVLEDFAGLLVNNGGWRFKVATLFSNPSVIRLTLLEGFDPRKPGDPLDTFSSTSTAIKDYTVEWARPFFQPSSAYTAHNIQGHFPELRFRLEPVGGGDAIEFVPLARQQAGGTWYNPAGGAIDSIMSGGTSEIFIPAGGFDLDGNPVTLAPAVNDEYYVWLYAVPVSDQNPLHIFKRPVELWEALRIANGDVAGVDYDDSNLAALTAEINTWLGGDVFLALRIPKGYKFGSFELNHIFGPFRLSTRVVNGLVQLYRFAIRGSAAPTDVIDMTDLRSEGYEGPKGTVFEIEERTIATVMILRQLRLIPWSTDESEQPDSDSLIARPWPMDGINNSDDDIPAGLAEGGHEVTIGDISGTITYDDGEPIPFEQFLRLLGDEFFEIFGRGAPQGELFCLPTVDKQVGEQVLVNLPHRPNAIVGRTPTSDNGGERRCLVISRTDTPVGPDIIAMDVATGSATNTTDDTVGGTTDEETDVTAATPPVPVLFGNNALHIARAEWMNAYPQFSTRVQFEGHASGETVFTPLYGGESIVAAGLFTKSYGSIINGWTIRARLQLTDGTDDSAFSAWSNEVEIIFSDPAGSPEETPTDLEATSSASEQSEAAWTNTDLGANRIRIRWEGSVQLSSPDVWADIAGGTLILDPLETSHTVDTGNATFVRFTLEYVNDSGTSGPAVTSEHVAVTP